jgi:hypothetical protein
MRSLRWIGLVVALASPVAFAGNYDYPNPKLTPGLADPSLTTAVLCDPGFSTKSIRRHGNRASGDAIYRSYGVTRDDSPCPCEIDARTE